MYQFITPIRLGFIVIFISVAFNNGCALKIQSPKPTTPAPGASQSPYATEIYHTVQPGETLLSIATAYGISNYQDLAVWNGLSASYPVIGPGMRLRVTAPLGYSPLSPTMTYPTYPVYPYTPVAPLSKSGVAPQRSVVRSGGDYHTVRKGETLHRIAKAYKRQTSELAAWNHLSHPYPLSVGQSLRVTRPTTSSKTASSPTALSTASNSRYYTVRQGDTLYNVASRYGQNITDISKWNDLQPPYTLSLNQQLLVKPPGGDKEQINMTSMSTTPKVPDVSVSTDETLYHSISAGETLYSISKTYGHSVEQVAAWNGLSPPYNNLKVGQNLRVSSGQKVQKTIASSKGKKTVSKRGKIIQYIVKNGETVYSIAQRYGIKVFDLVTLNGIGEPYTIYSGQKLKIIK